MVFQLIKNSSGSKSSILNEEPKVNHEPQPQQSVVQHYYHPSQHQQTPPPSLQQSQNQTYQQPSQPLQQGRLPQMYVQHPSYNQQQQPLHPAQFNNHQDYNQYPTQPHSLPALFHQPYGYYPPPLQQQQGQAQQQPHQESMQKQHRQQHPHIQYPQNLPASPLPHTALVTTQLAQNSYQQQPESQYRPPLSFLTSGRTTSYFDQNGTISLPPLNTNGGDLEQNELQRNRNRKSTKRHTIHGSDLSLLSKFRVEDGLNSSSFSKFASDLLVSNPLSSFSHQQPPSQTQASKNHFSPHIAQPQPSIYHSQPIHPVPHIPQQPLEVPSRQAQSTTTTQQQTSSVAPAAAVKQQKKYTCHCKRSFTTSGHLARHMRIHTGEKNYECPYEGCSARFSRQDNCMQHYRTHLGGRSRGNSANNNNSSSGSANSLTSNGRTSTSNRSRKSSSAASQNSVHPRS